MSKKLLGERQVGDTIYSAGQIFTDEDAAATGLPASDFAEVKAAAPAPTSKPAPVAAPDKDAEIDAQASAEKNSPEQSEQAGSSAGEGGKGAALAIEAPGEWRPSVA